MQGHEITALLLNVHGQGEHETLHLEWSSMVERAARAYFDAEAEVGNIVEKPWDETLEMVREEYRKAAQIVLQAAIHA